MELKNKLYHHHKSKFVLAMKQLSFSMLSLVAVFSAVAIPTYISSISDQKVVTQASEEVETQNDVKPEEKNAQENEEQEENQKEEKLLAY